MRFQDKSSEQLLNHLRLKLMDKDLSKHEKITIEEQIQNLN